MEFFLAKLLPSHLGCLCIILCTITNPKHHVVVLFHFHICRKINLKYVEKCERNKNNVFGRFVVTHVTMYSISHGTIISTSTDTQTAVLCLGDHTMQLTLLACT